MNARQKAKKYKRLYEALLKDPTRVKVGVVHRHKVDTLRCEEFYPDSFIAQENRDFVIEVISHDIARSFADMLGNYIIYTTEFCPRTNMYRVSGEIDVVNKEDVKT